MSNQNKAVYCLTVPERALPEVWKYNVVEEEYLVVYLVKVVKLD